MRRSSARQHIAAGLSACLLLLCTSLLCTPRARADAFSDPGTRGGGGGAAAANGDLAPVTPSVDGGQVTVGATGQVVVLLRNDSGHPLQVGAIQLYPSSTVGADVNQNQCSDQQLDAGAVCAVSISVKGLSAGAWRVEMLVRHNGRSKVMTAAANGQVVAGQGQQGKFVSDIEALPDKLDFGDVASSQPVIRSVVLRDGTSVPLDITSVYIESADKAGFSVKTDCAHLIPGQACIAVVTWSPVLAGEASGTLVIDHSGPTKVASVDLTGKYAPVASVEAAMFPDAVPGKGLLISSQKDVDFGTGINSTSAITVSLVNVGDSPVTIKDIRLASNDDGLSIGKKGCAPDTTLDPVDACPLTLTWSPVREGAILDDVQIIHDGTRGILVLPVKGTATGAISQDSKAIHLAGGGAGTLEPQESIAPRSTGRESSVDPATVLDGFTVTSHASTRAIISGPGGSRVVEEGQEVVLGGYVWRVHVRPSGVEFIGGDHNEKVLLLFDRSLAAATRSTTASGGSASGTSSGSASSGGSASSPASAAPAPHSAAASPAPSATSH